MTLEGQTIRNAPDRGGSATSETPAEATGSTNEPVSSSMATVKCRLAHLLFRPVPIAPLVYYRIAFGLVMVWEASRYLRDDWVHELFLAADFQFKYYGFEWVRRWPGEWMHLHFYGLAILGLMIAAGAWFRVASALFFLAFTYVFLLDQANYLNHLYLVCLLSFLMPFLPAHCAASIDATARPYIVRSHVPAWTWGLVTFQIAVPYFFGGIAKLTPDWLRGEPIRTWMRGEHLPVLGGWPATEAGVWVLSYGGLLFDLLVVPALLWRRTRLLALVAAVSFHLFNYLAFNIGIFPWLMLATLPLFLPLNWWERVNERWISDPAAVAPEAKSNSQSTPGVWTPRRITVAALIAAYVAVQVVVPLRHWLYPGVVHWTEDGHRFSWHMMLRNKRGTARYIVRHPELPSPVEVDPNDWLTREQQKKAATHPDMILQFAHYVAKEFEKEGFRGAEVTADVRVSLNGRPPQVLIDPNVNLASVRRSIRPSHWVLPLREPLHISPLPSRPLSRSQGVAESER